MRLRTAAVVGAESSMLATQIDDLPEDYRPDVAVIVVGLGLGRFPYLTPRQSGRNHRKLLVIDDTVAYMGSQNVTDSTYNLRKNIKRGLHWVDMMARLDGPVVASVNAVFLSDWYSETDEVIEGIELFDVRTGTGDLDCQVIPSGPGFEFQNNLKLFMTLLFAAREKIIIVSPYFVPDEALMLAQESPPDLVLLDWMIEGAPGIEVACSGTRDEASSVISEDRVPDVGGTACGACSSSSAMLSTTLDELRS